MVARGHYNRHEMKRFLLVALLIAGCASTPPREPVHVVLVGTTDVHGWLTGREDGGVARGGIPLFASYVEALREAHGGRVVLVDSGDMFQGTLESNLFEGEPVVQAYNAVGYDGAAVGNHEFDYGPVGPRVRAEPDEDELGALKRIAAMAKFPLLSANMTERATGRTPPWAKRYTTVELDGGVTIGVIGLSTPDTPNVTVEANVRDLVFGDPVAATIEAARELRAAGADAIVVTAHMGGRCSDLHDPRDLGSCQDGHEAMRFLEALPPGTIDVYFGGHTHAQMRHFVNGVPAVQSLPFSSEFSTVEIWVDPDAGRVVSARSMMRKPTMICASVYSGTDRCDPRSAPAGATLVPRVFEGKTIVLAPEVQKVVAPYLAEVAAKKNARLGLTSTGAFVKHNMRESDIGNLVADALRAWANADIAFMNSGGIRSNLRAGELIYSDIFEVSPFENYPAVVEMTGQQIIDALRATTGGDRGILQVSGLRYTIDEGRDADKPPAQRNRVASVMLENGEPLDPAKIYTVVMPDFLAHGGDGLAPVMKTVPASRIVIHEEKPVRDAVIEALQKRGTPLVPAVEGRITIINPR